MPTDIKIVQASYQDIIALLDDEKSILGRAEQHHVVSDVGATNCRIAIVAKGLEGVSEIHFVTKPANSVPELRAVYQLFVDTITPARLRKVVAASANVPAPASGLVGGPISNYKGATLKDRFVDYSTMPRELFPLENTVVMNDLEACAHGIVATSALSAFKDAFTLMWGAKKPHAPYDGSIGKGNCVVVAPGTGLGAAAIQYHHHDDCYTVFPLEFGHTNISYLTPTTSTQRKTAGGACSSSIANDEAVKNPTSPATSAAFLNDYAKDLYKGKNPVEYDDICAGRGMERAYKFLTAGASPSKPPLKAPQISKLASEGDKYALGAMKLYNKLIMNFCSQMAMGFQPKSIVICGDNAVKNSFFYTANGGENVKEMKEEYLEHSMERYGFMSKVHLLRQSKLMNLNLLGCAYVCETMKLHRKKSKL